MNKNSKLAKLQARTAARVRLTMIRMNSFFRYASDGVWSDTRRNWKVNTIKTPGKWKRMGVHVGKTPAVKKAVVTLAEDSKKIEIFENMT